MWTGKYIIPIHGRYVNLVDKTTTAFSYSHTLFITVCHNNFLFLLNIMLPSLVISTSSALSANTLFFQKDRGTKRHVNKTLGFSLWFAVVISLSRYPSFNIGWSQQCFLQKKINDYISNQVLMCPKSIQ